MFDPDWFLSILEKSDMAYICQKFRLNVTGFQRNLNNAPIKSLGNSIKTALNNGLQKKRGKKSDYLPYEEMMADIAKDLKNKYPYMERLTFEEFAIRAELEPDISLYEIVAITFQQFPNKYEEHYESIIENTKQDRYIFYGLSEELCKSPIEKIYKIVGADVINERNMELLKQFEETCLEASFKEIYNHVRKLVIDEESAFRVLAKSDKEIHIFVLVAFLLENERYKNENYKDLVHTASLDIQALELERLNLTIEEKEMEMTKIESQLQNIIEEKNSLEKDNSGIRANLDSKLEEERELFKTLESLTTKMQRLEYVLNKNEPLQMFFLRIITENNFIIVTKDVEHFIGTPFESVTILPTQFKKELKITPNNFYNEQIIFVTRSSFTTGTDWYQFKQLLEKHNLHYEELGQYDIACYIQEIIQYLSRKEVLIYADEL